MFSRADADDLREQLPSFDLTADPFASKLFSKYRAYYGLDAFSEVIHRIGCFESDGFSLVAQHFKLPDEKCTGTAVLMHGYYDHTGLFSHLIKYCLDNGLSVLIFDLPGHGLSSGEPASIDTFQRYSSALLTCCRLPTVSQLPRPWYAIGQSTGSATIIDSILHNELVSEVGFKKYILLCPLLYPAQWGRSKFLYYLVRPFLRSIPRGYADNSHDDEFLKFIQNGDALQCSRLPTAWVTAMLDYCSRFLAAKNHEVPLHLIQGTEDGTVDWRKNLPLFEARFPNAKIYMIKGARHHMVNESEIYREEIFQAVSKVIFDEKE